MKSLRILSLVLAFTFAFSTAAFADDPIDINSSAIKKDFSNFVNTMYYEPRDRVNNVIFYDEEYKQRTGEEYRLSSGKDYYVEYANNILPGTATITFTGVGKYTGTFSKQFTIKKMPIANITTKASFNKNKQLVVSANSGSEDLIYGTDFYVTSTTDINGNVKVKFYGKGTKYTGTCKKTIKAKNNPYPAPKSFLNDVIITKKKNVKGKKISLRWFRLNNVAGYQIKYSKKVSFAKAKKITINSNTKKYTIKNLKKKKTYHIKMRCFIVLNNKKYYGDWSSKVKVKIKK